MGVIAVVSLLGIFVGIIPAAKQALTLFGQIQGLATDVSLLRSKQTILQGMDESTLRNNLLTLASAVPPDKSLSTIMTTIDAVSGQTGVTVVDFTLTRPGSIATDAAQKMSADEAKIGSNVLPFSLTVRGTFAQIRAFVGKIAAVRRLFRVGSMNLTFTAALVEARIDLEGFYFPYPAQVGTVIAPITPLADTDQKTIAAVSAMPLSSVPIAVGTASASLSTGRTDPFAQ